MSQIQISFQTSELPPPHAYAYTLKLSKHGKHPLNASYQIEYLGRENLSEAEIEAEGFSENDDFSWEGNLPPVWEEGFRELTSMTLDQVSNSYQDYLFFIVDDEKEGHPKDQEHANLLLQELIQCILEVSGKETPMNLSIALPDFQFHLKASFSSRKLTALFNMQEMNLPWPNLYELLGLFENLELETTIKPEIDRHFKYGNEYYRIISYKNYQKTSAIKENIHNDLVPFLKS
jgi:hypothetical protein